MAEAFRREHGIESRFIDISADLHPLLGPALAHAYLQIIQKYPSFWDYLYDNENIAEAVQDLRRFYGFLEGGKLGEKIRELSPDLIVCTHALSFFSIASERDHADISCPLAAVITDFGVHTYWTRFNADLYIVPTERLEEGLRAKGILSAKIAAAGIPIHPVFEEPADKTNARISQGLSPGAPVLLLSGGSKALGPILDVADALLAAAGSAQLLIACGNNAKLFDEAKARYGGLSRVRCHARLPPERMKELAVAADLLIGKAGGLTCAECLAVGLPMVLFHPIPGQEERNVEYLVAHNAAAKAATLTELEGTVVSLLNEPDRLREMSRCARALGRPGSARQAAKTLAGLIV